MSIQNIYADIGATGNIDGNYRDLQSSIDREIRFFDKRDSCDYMS